MKIKTSDLTGTALDWAVGYIMGEKLRILDRQIVWPEDYSPSTDWSQGGPIIEREVITLIHPRWDGWTAHKYDDRIEDESYTLDGPTPLIAAMRCYVASQMGDEVEIPEELTA
jgi:hypothetical protein